MSHSSHTNSGSHTLVLNKDNIVNDGKNSTLEYKFPTSVNFKNEQNCSRPTSNVLLLGEYQFITSQQ